MKNYLTGYGLASGVGLYHKDKHITMLENGKVKKSSTKLNKISRIVFVRGLLLLPYFIYNFLMDFDASAQSVSKKQKIIFPLSFISLFLLFFVLFPIGTFVLFSMIGKAWYLDLLFGLCKIFFFLLFFFLLRFLPPMENVFRYNYLTNVLANSYTNEKIDYKKIKNSDEKRVLTGFNFFIFTMILFYFVASFLAFENVFATFFIKLFALCLIICVAFEVLYIIEYRRSFCPVSKFFAKGFYLINKLSTVYPLKSQQDFCLLSLEELNLMNVKRGNTFGDTRDFSQINMEVKNRLFEAGITEEGESVHLIAAAMDKKPGDVYFVQITPKDKAKINKALQERINGKPINKIFNKQNFYGYDFYINSNVLAPRQETEILVEHALKIIGNDPLEVLDLCTGSGNIAITIAKKSKCKVTAVDICAKALSVAQKNAENLSAKVKFIKSDLFNNLPKTKKFDIIVSNPPYIKSAEMQNLPQEVKNHDPKKSLDGGADGLKFYKKIAGNAASHLKKDGMLLLEIGFDQEKEVTQVLKANFKNVKTVFDYGDLPRVIIAQKG